MLDFDKDEKSLRHLERQFANYEGMDERAHLDTLDREAIAESVIQRFETCYDTLWKHLKRYLVEALGLPDVPNSPKPLFRIAHENNLLPGPIEPWLIYADARIATAHDYSGDKAGDCLAIMPGFLQDAAALLRTLSQGPPA